jgi:hypothetical protein
MQIKRAVGLALVLSLSAMSMDALADRLYSSMEECNAKCHGVCMPDPQNSNSGMCYWGANALQQKTGQAHKGASQLSTPTCGDGIDCPAGYTCSNGICVHSSIVKPVVGGVPGGTRKALNGPIPDGKTTGPGTKK